MWNSFYENLYKQRWPSLKEALLAPPLQIQRPNKWSPAAPMMGSNIPRGENGLLGYYVMDQGSIYCAKSLACRPGEKVLDMCAAPGGKTLILFEDMNAEGELIASEVSSTRREALIQVIRQYVPPEPRLNIRVSGKDGNRWGLEQPQYYDKILVDAPCSGDRHLKKEWSPKYSQNLALRQYSLLCSAWLAIQPGGRIVYSTCTLSPYENDGVIKKLLQKKGGIQVLSMKYPEGEATECGTHFLPDKCGFGPIYFSVLEKNC